MEDKVFTLASSLIKQFEGLRLKSYNCPGGYKTIGYGHVIRKTEQLQLAKTITKNQAEELLQKDIISCQNALSRLTQVPLNPYQTAALISFIFNLGSGTFQSSTLRQKINREEYDLAANEFPRWVYANGIKLPGLLRRRLAEKELFLRI